MQLTTHLHLVPRIRLSGAKHLLLQCLHGVEEKNFTYFTFYFIYIYFCFNPLNPELNPICYLLALLGAHHFLHVSRIRVKLLTLRLLMSYIYIWSTHS